MKEDWLDKNLGDKLDGYDSPMDLETAWKSLQAKRQVPKKKNRFFFFWMIFGLLTIGSWGSYFILNNSPEEFYNNISTKDKKEADEVNLASEIIATVTPTLSDSEKTKHNNNTFTTHENQNYNAKNIGFENQNYSKNITTETKTHFSKTKNNAFSKIQTSTTDLDFSEKPNTNFIFPKEKEEENNTLIDSTISEKIKQPIAISFLSGFEIGLLELPQQSEVEKLNASISGFYDSKLKEPKTPSTTFNSKNYLTISAGYGILSKGKILAQENPLDVISLNALYEKRFRNRKIYFKTGITFDQFVNSVENTTEQNSTQPKDDQLIAVNHFQNGTTEDVFGTADVSMIEKTTSKNFNRYRLVSVPLILGYDLLSSNRSSLQIEGGVARSIFGFHSGKEFDLVDSDFEKRRVWQGLYGLNFNLRITQNAQLFTSVKGNYHFNEIGKSDQLDMEKFSFHQIQVGVRFKL